MFANDGLDISHIHHSCLCAGSFVGEFKICLIYTVSEGAYRYLNGEEEISPDYLAVKLDNQFGGGVDIWKRLGSSVNATTNGLTIRLEPIHNVDIQDDMDKKT